MKIVAVIVVAGLTLGICFLLDKGFQKVFRGTKQHQSGKAVRYEKKMAALGLVLAALGVAAVIYGITEGWLLSAAGGVLVVLGVALLLRYATFGVYYDEDGFLLSQFGRRRTVYSYGQIRFQQLYEQYGGFLVELHLEDGRAFQLPLSMTGAQPFLDCAFENRCRQLGLDPQKQDYYDPATGNWFPRAEE